MRKYVIAALLAASAAAPAFAQDAATFTGPRIEGIVGYDTTDVEDEGADGAVYGVAVGYDVQMGGAVLGIEAEATDSSISECVSGVVTPASELCAKLGRDLYVGGRIGAVVGSRALLYAKAGYTNGRVSLDYEDGTPGTALDSTLSENLDGVRAGAGIEYALGTNMFVKAEYRYSNYEEGFDKHQGVAGFGFRF
ncbi:outer membrane protein [Sphingosinicella rhizophila]|uniref:Porin family protein n=1 Tax=Sphingosinicella rhizophila TaxID=3050082 RepID=A0ABU3Q7S3_9SPHN|nr:porin family protein [Sphingosinicella sp. GR2756]MDT9599451.1 porin family protein [Sphingosinicella sp. GR2756]